jgi:radical SAM protein with 4Fe4S-binding SPASM domain
VAMTIERLKELYEATLTHPVPQTTPRGPSECMFIHRTAVIMTDGEVVTCANMYAENVGHLGREAAFTDIWNNDRMQSVRSAIGTPDEWSQCTHCWFREIRYGEQRAQWATQGGPATQESLRRPAKYQPISWDFRKQQRGKKAEDDQ